MKYCQLHICVYIKNLKPSKTRSNDCRKDSSSLACTYPRYHLAYRIYPKYSDTSTPLHIYFKFERPFQVTACWCT